MSIIQQTIKNLANHDNGEIGDYLDDEGFLMCGKCKTRKQYEIELFGEIRKVPIMCKCKEEKNRKEKLEIEKNRFQTNIEQLQRQGMTDLQYLEWTLKKDDNANPKISKIVQRYIEKWPEMKESNTGLMFFGDTGTGKALTIETDIITPTGNKKMKDIHVGDKVIGWDGKPCNVIGEYPQGELETYKITFDDGTQIECCENHLWIYKTPHSRNKEWRVATLREMMNRHKVKGKGHWTMAIPKPHAVQYETNSKLPIKPYALGALIGDGGISGMQITFTNPESDVREKVFSELSDFDVEPKCHIKDLQYTIGKKRGTGNYNKLKTALKELGLAGKHSNDKFIPKEYLVSSVDERKELLAGLFDTDGHISKNGSKSITTTSLQLVKDIMQLSRSLGIRCTLRKPDERHGNICYSIGLQTKQCIYTSKKHTSRDKNRKHKGKDKKDYMSIVSIEKSGRKECKCITVDNETESYLCGDFIVTHNTFCAACIANALIANGVSVLMTSFPTLLSSMNNGGFENGKQRVMEQIANKQLVIIDDLGVERGTDYSFEKVYEVIDTRYKSGKPLIITTNLTKQELENPTDIRNKRIYDRILEMCLPILVAGESRRTVNAAVKRKKAKELLGV